MKGYFRTVCGIIMTILAIILVITNVMFWGTDKQIYSNLGITLICLVIDICTFLPFTKKILFYEIIKPKNDESDFED
jgi:vancomycin permeability regulator SanA